MAKPRTLFLFVGLLSVIIYVSSLAPTITWRNDGADSGDLATAVAVGGVPHPPGYPTYLILGEVFKLLPLGDIAYRLNLMSATCAALTAAVVGLIIYHTLSMATSDQPPPRGEAEKSERYIWLSAAVAALTLAFSDIFWSQAVIAEVYALNALLTAVLLYGALRVHPANEGWLVPGLFVVLGLSVANHPSILLFVPMLIWILKARWHLRLVVASFLAFCAGLSIYVIIPIRAATSPPINWGMATTWPHFVWLVSAKPYRQFLFALPWRLVPARIATESRLLTQAFMWWGLFIGLLGLQRLMRHNRSLGFGSLVTFLLISVYAIGYNTTDSYVYLLPAMLILALWIGWGLDDLANAVQNSVRSIPRSGFLIASGIALLPVLSLSLNFPDQNLRQDEEARTYAQQSLELVAPSAVVVADNDPHTFALWYGRYGLALRPDVAIINSNLLPYAWYRQSLHQTHTKLRLSDQAGRPLTTLPTFIEWNLPNSPIYLATLEPFPLDGYRLEPTGQLQRVLPLSSDE